MIYFTRYETIDRSHQSTYNDTNYSNLISPEKVNTLERSKKEKSSLLSEMNTLDSATFGQTNSYGQNSHYNSIDKSPKSPLYDQNSYKKFDNSYNQNYDYRTESFATFGESQTQSRYSTPYKSEHKTENKFYLPESYKTDVYKYENIHSAKPIEEKGFTSTPNTKIYGPSETKTFEVVKNGSDHQMSYSNVEYDSPMLTDLDSLEQRMCKQSITQKIVEKKTVHMSSTSKHESSTKSFRFE